MTEIDDNSILHNILLDYTKKNVDSISDLTQQDLLCDYFKMYAITDTTFLETFDDGVIHDGGRITLAYENLSHIPKKIADKFADHTRILDLSHNNFKNLSFLSNFKYLHTLVLDRNSNPDDTTLPFLPMLEILWLNNCNIRDIFKWIYKIKAQCPRLKFLSIMGNPGATTMLNGASIAEHNSYRLHIISILTNLIYLDDTIVTDEQKDEATLIKNEFDGDKIMIDSNIRGSSNLRNIFQFSIKYRKSIPTSSNS